MIAALCEQFFKITEFLINSIVLKRRGESQTSTPIFPNPLFTHTMIIVQSMFNPHRCVCFRFILMEMNNYSKVDKSFSFSKHKA